MRKISSILKKKIKKKSEVEKEIKRFKKLENKFKRKEKLKSWRNKGHISINWIGEKINKFLEKIRYMFRLPKQSILKARVKRDKRGIIIMDSGFIDELKEKTKDQNHKGKWLKINLPNKEEKQIRKMKAERKALVILMSRIRERKLKQNKISDPVYNTKMEKYQERLEKIREELPFLEARLIKNKPQQK
jgi:predicted membrane chloride channel (bestrophin family)